MTIAIIAHGSHMSKVYNRRKFIIIFAVSAMINTFTLSFTFPNHAKIPKLIINSTLKIRNGAAYIKSFPEYKNFMPNNILDISGQKTKKIHPILTANMEKYL
jgi:hypothetical protein